MPPCGVWANPGGFWGQPGLARAGKGLARDEHPAQFGALGHARNFGGRPLVPAARSGDLIGTATPHLLEKVALARPREAPPGDLRPAIPRLGRASEPDSPWQALPARAASAPNRRDSPAVLALSRGRTAAEAIWKLFGPVSPGSLSSTTPPRPRPVSPRQ